MKGTIEYWVTSTVMLFAIGIIFITVTPAYDAIWDMMDVFVTGNTQAVQVLTTSKLGVRIAIMVSVISLMILVALSSFKKEYETGGYQRY